MNIHFTDIELFQKLKDASLVKVEVGSTMYGLNTPESDVDYLYIYATSDRELSSMIRTHHQLQYIEDGIDHNFVSLHTFLHNCMNGDSTINFEVINSEVLKGTCLEFLYDNRMAFHNYSMIRSYLGLARRDHKHYFRAVTHRDKVKKIIHMFRGLVFAQDIMEGCFKLNSERILSEAEKIRSLDNEYNMKPLIVEIANGISSTRDDMNDKLNEGTLGLPKLMKLNDIEKIDEMVIELTHSYDYLLKKGKLYDMDLSMYRNAFENWVEYNQDNVGKKKEGIIYNV